MNRTDHALGLGEAGGPRTRDAKREARLVEQALPLLDLVAIDMWRRTGGRVALDELASAGREAIVPLVRRYDPAQSRLEPYLNQRLRWAMRDALRRDTHSRVGGLCAREPTPARLRSTPVESAPASEPGGPIGRCESCDAARSSAAAAMTIVVCAGDMTDAPDLGGNPEQTLSRRREARRLWAHVARLPDRQRRLVEAHYRCGARIDQIGAAMGISKSRASRLHRQALERLGTALDDERGWRPGVARPRGGRAAAARRAARRGDGARRRPIPPERCG